MLAKAKLASSIAFIVLASFTIVTYDRQNMFIIQATGALKANYFRATKTELRYLSTSKCSVLNPNVDRPAS